MDDKRFELEDSGDFENEPAVALDEKAADMADTDEGLVSPDRTIFTQVAEKLNKPERHVGYAATFHGGNNEKDKFDVDEQYASSANADKHFMEAFGLSETGTHKTMSHTTREDGDFGKDNIYSNEYEYTDPSQRGEIRNMYIYAKKSMKRRLIFCFIFTAFLFLQENIFRFLSFENFNYLNINEHPYIHMGIGLGALLLCTIFAREQLYHGLRSLIKKEYTPESVAVISLVAALLHLTVSFVFELILHDFNVMLFNFPAAAVLLCSILFTYINIKRERYGFSVVSVKKSKFVLEKVNESNAEAEYDTFTTTSNGEFAGQIARVARTPFVKNYFANTNTPVKTGTFLKFYYIFAVAVPFVLALISAFVQKLGVFSNAPYASLTYFFVGVQLTLPVGILFAYSVPFLVANTNLYDHDVAIIGEEAIDEFAGIEAVVVNDTTAFPPQNVKIKNIMGYNDYTIEKITYLAASGFSVVGGPLADVFDAVLNDALPKSSKTKFVCAGRSYLSVSVDGHAVIFADKYGMTAQGIEVGSEREDKNDMAVMYMACDGILCSKMYIKYGINQEFVKATKQINSKDMSIGIRTFDPNINNDLITKLAGLTKKEVRVIKLDSSNDIPTPTQRCDGRIVSKGSSSALLKGIITCRRIVKTRKVLKAVKIIASLVGAAYIGLCVFEAFNFFKLVGSGIIVLLYALIALLMYVITVIMLPSKK